jgi:hypothetical protein
MAKSPTKRNQELKKKARALAEEAVAQDLIYTYLNWWTRKQVDQLVHTGNLVIMPADNGYMLGKHQIINNQNDGWTVLNQHDDILGYFSTCQTAVLYSLFEQKHLYSRSNVLKICDHEVIKLDNNVRYFRHKYKHAIANGQGFKADLWEARLSDSVPKLEHAKDELQKLVISAKYMKVWDNDHETARIRK